MSLDSNVLRAMQAAGCTVEQIIAAVAASESVTHEKVAARREAERLRKRRQRAVSRDVTAVPRDIADKSKSSDISTPAGAMSRGTNGTVPRAHVEDNSLFEEIEPQQVKKESKTPKGDVVEFQNELSDLDADRLEALIKHRRSKRAQITGMAARLLRRDVEACGLTMADGVDMCISRNWITIKPDWLESRSRAAPASGRPPSALELRSQRLREKIANDYGFGRQGSGDPQDAGVLRIAGGTDVGRGN